MTESWERIYWLNQAAAAEQQAGVFLQLHDEYMERARKADRDFKEENNG